VRILVTVDPEIPVPPTTYGGIERIVHDLSTALRERGHHVGMIAHADSTSSVDEKIAWPARSPMRGIDTFRNAMRLHRAVRDFMPDVLHSFSRLAYMTPVMSTGLAKVMSYQRPPSGRTVRLAQRMARSGSLHFTGCSVHIADMGRRAAGTWSPIHNFVDLRKFTFRESVSDDAPVVFLSRIEEIKGAHTAIEIAKRCGIRLVIAGNHADSGPQLRYWEERIRPEIGRNGIEYVGCVDDAQKNELLGAAMALLVPISWNEPFGIVFAEALACGTPVISAPRGALPEIVRHGVEGFLVEGTNDACSAVAAIAEIDRARCRHRVEEEFCAPRIVGKYCDLYRHAVDNAGVASPGKGPQ
jgi:glycosyltransferase involved in cell wall biosynthesis